jgi:hypothetical protein
MRKLGQWFFRGLSLTILGITFAIVFVSIFLPVMVFVWASGYWLFTAHWLNATPCFLVHYFQDHPKGSRPPLELYEVGRCSVTTGLEAVDGILDYFINDLSVFISGPIIAILALVILVYPGLMLMMASMRASREFKP